MPPKRARGFVNRGVSDSRPANERLNDESERARCGGGLARTIEFARDTPDLGVADECGVPTCDEFRRGDSIASIRFVLGTPGVTSLVVGSLNLAHLRENVEVAQAVTG